MKVLFTRVLLFCFLVLAGNGFAQRPYWEMMQDSAIDLPGAKEAFRSFWEGKTPEKGQGYKQFLRWEYMQELRADQSGNVPGQGYEFEELKRWEAEQATERRSNAVPNGNWTHMGPVAFPTNMVGQPGGIGRLTTIAFHPTDPNTIFVGSGAGGLWTSTDLGATWTTNTDFLATLGISAIVLTPSNPDIRFAGTGDKDAGDASGLGMFKSIDGGLTWASSTTGMGNRTVHSLVMDPNNESVLIAGTSGGIYRSVNAGANWTQVLASGTTYQVGYSPGSNSILYAVNQTNLYTSTDDGATWNAGVAISGSNARAAFATTPAAPNTVLIVQNVVPNPVFASYDGGATISQIQTDGKNLLNSSCAGTGTGGQGWYDIAISIDPSNANNVMVGGVSLWKSTDGGVNFSIAGCWSSMATNVHADHHFLAYSPHFANRLFDCNDGGLYYTDNFGSSYTNLSSGIAVSQIYRVGLSSTDPSMAVAGLQDNGMLITRQPNWYITVGGDGTECEIDPTDNNFQYGSYVNGVIRRSMNAGYNWGTIANSSGTGGINEAGPWVTPYCLQPGNPNVMLAGYASIWRSNNVKAGSPTFSNVHTLSGSSIRDIEFADANTAYASRANGEFFRSDDGGLTWTQVANPPGGSAKDIATNPNTPLQLWVASGNNVYQSNDGGVSWILWDASLPNISCLSVVYDYIGDAVYCGMWTGVYYRGVSDPAWVAFNSGLPNTQALHLQIYYDGGGCRIKDKLRLATYGRGLWESDLYASPTMPPSVCFGADTTGACVGSSIVTLLDSTEFNPTSWLWNITGPGSITFVNSTSNTSQNPQVIFGAVGTYTVTLTATNGNGSDAVTRTNYIQVDFPSANFSASDSLIYEGQSIAFSNLSSPCAGTYLWDFGDGNTSALPSPTHTYAVAGLYTVSLTLDGGVATVVRNNSVQVLPHLSVPFTQNEPTWTGDMENNATAWHFGDRRFTGSSNPWQRGSVTTTFPAAASGSNCWATLLSGNVTPSSSMAAVLTPTFDLSLPGQYQVRLKHARQAPYCNAPYGTVVEYTTDLGGTWTRLGGKQGVDPATFANWYNCGGTGGCDNADVAPGDIGWASSSTNFNQGIYDASALAGNARVGFRVAFYNSAAYGQTSGKGFAFDDFEIDFIPNPGPLDTIPGNLAAFDGVDDYIETYYGANFPQFTVEAWVMSPNAPSSAARTSMAQKSNVFEMNWNHPSAASRGAVALRNSGGTWQSYTFGALAANTWYHLAIAFDGSNVRTYKNGELITNAAFTGTLTTNANYWQLGNGSAYFQGQMDEFRIWNTARTTNEIREGMHRTLEQPELANVVLYYQGNEASGYLKDPVALRNGYLMNGMGRTLSPVAVGKGVSQSLVVNGVGAYNFNVPALVLNYTSFVGANQEVTVTRIQQFVNQQAPNPVWNAAPNSTLTANNPFFYYAVNGYGVVTFNTDIRANNVPGITAGEAATPASLKLVKRASNSVSLWDAGIPAVAANASSGPAVFDGWVEFQGITSFSQMFIGKEPGIFELSDILLEGYFDSESGKVVLAWEDMKTGAARNWSLQRSEELGLPGEMLNLGTPSAAIGSYSAPWAGLGSRQFFRIQAQDLDGSIRWSNWVELSKEEGWNFEVMPNPADRDIRLQFVMPKTGPMELRLLSVEGKMVWETTVQAEEGFNQHPLHLPELASGMYILEAQGQGMKAQRRLILR